MTRILFLIAFSFLFQWNGMAQEKINNYKYIIVPNQFDFQKSEDQYQLNSLTKFLFNKYGYTSYLESDEYPSDLGANNCLALKAIVKEIKGGFLVTKIQIDLVDCKNRVIVTSQVGKSKMKKREKAYQESTRAAFITYQFFEYKYNGNAAKTESTSTVETTKVEAITKPTPNVTKVSEEKIETAVKPPVKVVVKDQPISVPNGAATKDVLYAQPIDLGYQVVDTEPKKVMILLYSGIDDTFIVQGKDAIVYKKGDIWVYAENSGKDLQVKGINLKF